MGIEGSMDEIVAKARFEETKLKELSGRNTEPQPRKTHQTRGQSGGHTNQPSQTMPATTPPAHSSPADQGETTRERRGKKPVTCFQYGMEGHMRSNCPYPKTSKKGSESRGKPKPQMGSMTSQKSSGSPQTEQQK